MGQLKFPYGNRSTSNCIALGIERGMKNRKGYGIVKLGKIVYVSSPK
jgi:hypothetical protein